jgi:hypothetical protein
MRKVRYPGLRLSGECPDPCESTAVRLIRLNDLLGHLGVQDRPHVSTTVVSIALAAGLYIRGPCPSASRAGVKPARLFTPGASPGFDPLAVASSLLCAGAPAKRIVVR